MNSHLGAFASAVGLHHPLRMICTCLDSGNMTSCEVFSPSAIVGRWPQCAIHLDHPSVSKRHAYLQVIDGQIYFSDLGSRTGLKLDAKPLSRGWFPPGASLTVGGFELRHSFGEKNSTPTPLPTEAVTPGTNGSLAIVELSQAKVSFVMKHHITILGRDRSCNMRMDHPAVSRFHAVIVQTGPHAWLVDLNCGTTLNGRSVRAAPLQLGDRIGFKHATYEVQMDRPEARSIAVNPPMPPPVFVIAPDALTALDTGDSVSAAIGEIRQQTLMMTQVFMKMQQEQMALMKQQMELIQELVAPLKNQTPVVPLVLAENVPSTPTATALPNPQPIPQTTPIGQKPPAFAPGEEKAIEEAHRWFMAKSGKQAR